MKKKLLSIIALLCLAVTGAWADTVKIIDEGFEGGSMPTGWTADQWVVGTGDYSSSTGSSEGSYNALITNKVNGERYKLITPTFDLSGYSNAILSFSFINRSWAGDLDQLTVYYRTSATSDWQSLEAYTTAHSSWTDVSMELPNTAYQVAFEMFDGYGYGIGIDNVVLSAEAAGGYALTTGENAHGTVSYTVGGNSVSKATEGDVVTVTVTPDAGWSTKEVTARGYMPWGGASSRRQVPMTLLDEIPVSGSGNTWTFTMPTANALVNVTYKKELSNTDITISDITSPTYTGEELEPAIVVKDGTTTLVEGVDYTVSYTNNINAALATDATAPTVTITAVATSEKYSGSASKKFTILKADIPESDITAPTPKTLVYNQGTQTLINGGSAVGGTMQYSLNGSTYSTVLPSGNGAGTYTVYYRIVGDSNHNDVAPRTITVTIAQAVIDYMQLVKSVFIFNDETQIATVDVVKAGSLIVPESGYVVTGRSGYSVGIYTVTVTGVGNYAGSATAEFSIRKDLGSISYATTEVNKTYGNAPFTNKLTKSGDGQVTYSSDNTKVATVDADGQVTIVGVGTAVIKATVADGPVFGYATKEASYTLTVQAYKMNLHVAVAEAWLYADKIAADYADIAAKLQAAVDAGYVVFYNDDATQVEVDAAQAEMEKALAKAKADVETATAIAGVKAAKADGEVLYDLQGRRVDSPVKGRVYILKGKKVVY